LEELVAGLLRPRLFPFGKLSKAKSAAQVRSTYVYVKRCETVPWMPGSRVHIYGLNSPGLISPTENLLLLFNLLGIVC
jgi:hypothetical protein